MAQDQDQDGITAYHGSPHEFDKFDTSKIGTGEGAQAYGHGLYFAESEPIAKHYRDALSSNKFSYDKIQPDEEAVKKFSGQLADVERRMAGLTDENGFINLDANSEDLEKYAEEKDKIKNMMVMDTINRNPHLQYGRMYEVNINAHPDHFLDWDKKFTDQSNYVKNALRTSGVLKEYTQNLSDFSTPMATRNKMKRGENIHAFIEHKMGKDSEKTSQFLQSIGLKGIKYLDAMSRDKGRGSRNYVVFDHNDVDIKRRYEQGGAVPLKKLPAHKTQKRDGGAIVKRALMVISQKA